MTTNFILVRGCLYYTASQIEKFKKEREDMSFKAGNYYDWLGWQIKSGIIHSNTLERNEYSIPYAIKADATEQEIYDYYFHHTTMGGKEEYELELMYEVVGKCSITELDKNLKEQVKKYYKINPDDYRLIEAGSKDYYGGLLIIFDEDYLKYGEGYKGTFFKNKKGLVIFKADENGPNKLTIDFSRPRNRFYPDEVIVKMEAEQGYTSGFYRNSHWKIK